MELRLQHIRRLEVYWRENFARLTEHPQSQYRGFNDFEVSTLLEMDLDFLRLIDDEPAFQDGVLAAVHAVPSVLKICGSSGYLVYYRCPSL